MTDSHLRNDILRKINDEHITPKPRWEFLLKDTAVWVAGIVSLVIGGLATSVIIYMIRSDDWEIISATDDTPLQILIVAMPYFWILTLVAFVLVAHYNFKHTKKGYQYRIPYVVLGSILVSAILGVFFYDAGAGRAIDRVFMERIPMYEHFGHPKILMWMRPEKGMLAGTLVDISATNTFRLKDMQERVWIVRTTGPAAMDISTEQIGATVRCIGRPSGPGMFDAVRILPMFPPQKPIIFRGR